MAQEVCCCSLPLHSLPDCLHIEPYQCAQGRLSFQYLPWRQIWFSATVSRYGRPFGRAVRNDWTVITGVRIFRWWCLIISTPWSDPRSTPYKYQSSFKTVDARTAPIKPLSTSILLGAQGIKVSWHCLRERRQTRGRWYKEGGGCIRRVSNREGSV